MHGADARRNLKKSLLAGGESLYDISGDFRGLILYRSLDLPCGKRSFLHNKNA